MLSHQRLIAVLAFSLLWLAPAHAVDRVAGKIGTELKRLARAEDFSGVVLIAKHGKPIFSQAYGLANRSDAVANRTSTRFNMASMGKMITAVAIMQLAESGRISLDGTVGRYLPAYPNAVVREQVTIKQLLTHTSGLGSFWEQMAEKPKERYDAVADYVPLFAESPLEAPPGKQFSYSNNGYIVLGLIIEAMSGESYFDYVRKHVYEPAGMTNTQAFRLDQVTPRMANGYARNSERPGELMNNIYVNTYRGGPAGGSYTTAGDLLKFSEALLHHRLLSAAATIEMTTGKVDYGKRRYGFGFIEDRVNGHRLIGHSGGHVGIADELMMFPDLGYTAVILTNGDVENFWAIQNVVKREIAGSSQDTQHYEFTQAVIRTLAKDGLHAAQSMVAQAGDQQLRSGLLQQTGEKLLWQQNLPAARALFALYTRVKPDDADAWLGLGNAHERSGGTSAAVEAFRHYLQLLPEDKAIRSKLESLEKLDQARGK